MRLEDQVCSLELAKRLKELGVKQDSLFYWIKEEEPYIWYNPENFNYPMKTVKWNFSAFTVAELGEILPPYLSPENASEKESILDMCKDKQNRWLIAYATNSDLPARIAIIGDTEANARAKMLIYLIENKLIDGTL